MEKHGSEILYKHVHVVTTKYSEFFTGKAVETKTIYMCPICKYTELKNIEEISSCDLLVCEKCNVYYLTYLGVLCVSRDKNEITNEFIKDFNIRNGRK